MRILIVLTYYRPHYSGLTIYTERLARALAARGHNVTVLTSRFEPDLPLQETVNGVEIIRLPVWLRISKGVLMPGMPLAAWKHVRQADVVNLHLPQLDAAPISLISRLLGKPVALTYHCDLLLPGGFINRLANIVSNTANQITARASNLIVTNTQDYADNSQYLNSFKTKIHPIPPPAYLPPINDTDLQKFQKKYSLHPEQRVIGMVGRLAAEKGAQHLIQALPAVLEKYPQARVLHVGQYQDVLGEEEYARMLSPMVNNLESNWKFLGIIPDKELAAFFRICDVVVLPSTNSTESFGIVQVEAMTSGTPAVVSDMPGLRQPVLNHGMGKIFPVGDAEALAAALIEVLETPSKFLGDLSAISQLYSPDTIAGEYEELFSTLSKETHG
ncbi:MAG: glycosyltransferase family 4 protein [Chloroflexi bacterium]|nr:glycosyltransferase family 4 protein [Chloroflexota bacterium]